MEKTSFRKMRLIPELMYERLSQDQTPRKVDYGDKSNDTVSISLTRSTAKMLTDKTISLEQRIRLFNQHLIRQLGRKRQLPIPEGDDSKKKKGLEADQKENKKEGDMTLQSAEKNII